MARKQNQPLEVRVKFVEITDEEIDVRLDSIAEALLASAVKELGVPNAN